MGSKFGSEAEGIGHAVFPSVLVPEVILQGCSSSPPILAEDHSYSASDRHLFRAFLPYVTLIDHSDQGLLSVGRQSGGVDR